MHILPHSLHPPLKGLCNSLAVKQQTASGARWCKTVLYGRAFATTKLKKTKKRYLRDQKREMAKGTLTLSTSRTEIPLQRQETGDVETETSAGFSTRSVSPGRQVLSRSGRYSSQGSWELTHCEVQLVPLSQGAQSVQAAALVVILEELEEACSQG